MQNPLFLPRWSPYAVGAAIGVLSWVTFAWMGKALGTSTTMVNAAGVLEGVVSPEHVKTNDYLAKHVVGKSAFEWQAALVVALFFGALIAARLGRERFKENVPELWKWRFGANPWVRYAGAFAGGAILLFGARMAGGCTSGHSISGGLQLAVSSWVFTGAMFAAGVATAFLMFGKGGRSHV
jgi:uncharacterized membrane protein YedE/YeeE